MINLENSQVEQKIQKSFQNLRSKIIIQSWERVVYIFEKIQFEVVFLKWIE